MLLEVYLRISYISQPSAHQGQFQSWERTCRALFRRWTYIQKRWVMWNPYHLCILHIYFLIYRKQNEPKCYIHWFHWSKTWILKKRQEILFLLGYLLTWVVSRSWLLFPKVPGTMGRIQGCRVEGRWCFQAPMIWWTKAMWFWKGASRTKKHMQKVT